jgi:hypothetical protein
MTKKININLININSKADLLICLDNVFNFTFSGVNPDTKKTNWDSFIDSFRCLDSDSKTIANDPDFEKITEIHLVLENYKAVNNIDPEDKKIFEEILEEMTHKENRYDEYDFSYEKIM